MASDKRADIVALVPGIKLVIELKRDYHAAIWTAIQNQLDRFYTRDPEAKGFGIYGVFWYGSIRPRPVPRPPTPMLIPRSATEMQHQLTNLLPQEKRQRIQVFVIDVSSPLSDVRAKRPRTKRGKVTKPQGAKKRSVTKASKKRQVKTKRRAMKKSQRENKRKEKNRRGRSS